MKAEQLHLETHIINIVTRGSSFPSPGRPLRNVAARCLVLLYMKGDTKTIYDSLQTFIKVSGDAKAQDNELAKLYVSLTLSAESRYDCIRNLELLYIASES